MKYFSPNQIDIKLKYPKILLLILVIFSNCSKEDAPVKKLIPEEPVQKEPEEPEPDPEPIVYFTFSIDNSIDTSKENNWVILHDANGDLLDYRAYESGETLEFEALESEITENINVSLFKNANQYLMTSTGDLCEGEANKGTTYPNISKGSHWTQGKYSNRLDNGPAPEKLGLCNLNLTSIPSEYNFINDNVYGGLGTGNISTERFPEPGSSGSIVPNGETKTITREGIRNLKDTEYLMTILNENLDFKHLFFQNPEIGTDVTLDYNEFLSFDSLDYLPVFPVNNGYQFTMVGFENETSFKSDTGFVLLELFSIDVGDNRIPLGYLDRFTYYKTSLNMIMDNFTYQYNKLGTKPSISSIPDEAVISYAIDHLINFDLTFNHDYVRRSDTWSIPKSVSSEDCTKTTWTVECDQQNYPVIKELPEELFTQYPSLGKLTDLKYASSVFYLQSETYPELITKEFDPNHDHIISSGYTEEYIRMNEE